ncbi:MAG: UbiA family prenyltransferase [Candidatus Diapherotrites archaeon]
MAAFGAFVGYSIAAGTIEFNFIVLFAMLAALLVSAGGMVINDYFDRDVDKSLRPERPIPSKKIHASTALMLAVFLFVSGNAFAALINPQTLAIAFLFSLLLIHYSASWREYKYIGNWIVAAATGFTIIFGAAAFELTLTVLLFALVAMLTNVSREIGKDFDDLKNDFGFKKTLPMILPEKIVVSMITSFLVIAIILVYVPFVFYSYGNLLSIAIVTFANVLFLFSLVMLYSKNYSRFSALTKAAMFTALIGFLMGVVGV